MSKHIRAILGLKLAKTGVGIGQDHFLVVLDPGRSTGVGDLSDALAVRPSTVSKMVDRMVTLAGVERQCEPGDARRTLVALTPLGEDLRRQVLEIWAEIDADLRASLDDVDAVERQVRAIDERLTTYLSRLR